MNNITQLLLIGYTIEILELGTMIWLVWCIKIIENSEYFYSFIFILISVLKVRYEV